jgi:hypothetical protein
MAVAVEIALKHKYRTRSTGKKNASRGNNSGTNKHRGETDKNRMAFAQQQTRVNQRMLIMLPTGKFQWVLAADWAAGR